MAKLRLPFTKEAQASTSRTSTRCGHSSACFPVRSCTSSTPTAFTRTPSSPSSCRCRGAVERLRAARLETVEETDGAGIAEKSSTRVCPRACVCGSAIRSRVPCASSRSCAHGWSCSMITACPPARPLRALFARRNADDRKAHQAQGVAQIDIAPLIREMTLTEQDGSILADAVVAAQNGLNPPICTGDRARASVAQPDFVACAARKFTIQRERFPLKIARAAATLDDFIEKYKICACNLAKSVILFLLAF